MFNYLFQIREVMRKFRINNITFIQLFFLTAVIIALFSFLIVSFEDLRWFDALYFSFITGATIGYGDIYPHSDPGKIATVIYAALALIALPAFFAILGTKFFDSLRKQTTGRESIRGKIDLLIAGGFEIKQEKLVNQLLFLNPNLRILILCNIYEEKPAWMRSKAIRYIRGSASNSEDFLKCKGQNIQEIILLANSPDDRDQDGFTLLAHQVIRHYNQNAEILAEKVRYDNSGFPKHKKTLWIPISRPGLIAKEALLTFGATFGFFWEIFKNSTKAQQYNTECSENSNWGKIRNEIDYAIGFKNPGKDWIWCPAADDKVEKGALIKYFSLTEKQVNRPKKESLLIIGYKPSKTHQIVLEYLSDPEYAKSQIDIITNELDKPPKWSKDFGEQLRFIFGPETDIRTLQHTNCETANDIVILAKGFEEISDQKVYLTYCCARSLNPNAYIIAEVNREDRDIFTSSGKEVFTDISEAEQIVEELHHPGALDLVTVLSDLNTDLDIFQLMITKEWHWKDLLNKLLENDCYAVGYCLKPQPYIFIPDGNPLLNKPEVQYLSKKELNKSLEF
jgi:hypothetical protein